MTPTNLPHHFSTLEDSRMEHNKRHTLLGILASVVNAVCRPKVFLFHSHGYKTVSSAG
ncbi:MAG: hypothetical protein HZT40_16255 [Candidatus Thiothrix singaporensis]|uniref:Uncharacterized protein n=1 Tax=Candidatus Thiothrix singaporensis TaxID=2799669 RepID=A0A7L6AUZ0_9GAMM|nr:MAG: hypothetical protein HZT40_16255 [Candidatus Thiothrix singaporensis]